MTIRKMCFVGVLMSGTMTQLDFAADLADLAGFDRTDRGGDY